MKTYINITDLKAAFTKLSKVISTKTSIAILENVLVEVSPEKTYFTVSNSDQTIRITLDNDFTHMVQSGINMYDFKKLHTFIKKSKANHIEFNGNTIISNKLKLNLSDMDYSEYPKIPDNNGNKYTLSAHDYKKSVNKVAYAVSTSDGRPMLKGINTVISNNDIMMVATDSHRLAKNTIENVNFDNETSFVIDGKTTEKMAAMIGKKDSDLVITDNPNNITFEFENIEFINIKIDGNYPNTNRLIPESMNTQISLNKNELAEVLPNLEMISKYDRNSVVSFNFNGSVKIEATNESKESMEMELINENRYGNDLEIHFNSKYLQDVVKVSDNEMLQFEFNGALRPFTITDANAIHLILPVRKV